MGKKVNVLCVESKPCFANSDGVCTLLKSGYKEGECPFCKPTVNITNGKKYPFSEITYTR